METYAPFIGLAALVIALITWLRADLRKVESSVSELSNRLDAQGRDLRQADEASEQRLRDAIAAQGKEMREANEALGREMREANEALGREMREAITAQGKEMREANEASEQRLRDAIAVQGKEFRERTDGLAKDVAELQAGVSVIKARLDQPLFVKVVRDELEDAA